MGCGLGSHDIVLAHQRTGGIEAGGKDSPGKPDRDDSRCQILETMGHFWWGLLSNALHDNVYSSERMIQHVRIQYIVGWC